MTLIVMLLLHLLTMFFAVTMVKVGQEKGFISEPDMCYIISMFIPIGVLVFAAALWLGEAISDRLT